MEGYVVPSLYDKYLFDIGIIEINKKRTISGKLMPYQNGFSFYKNLEDIASEGNVIQSTLIYKVEAKGKVVKAKRRNLYFAESISWIKELSQKEKYEYFANNQKRLLKKDTGCRRTLASFGLCLDKLVYDKSWLVRKEVANQRYHLDILINDKQTSVRVEVAKKGYKLNKLINDEDWEVRMEVANQKYGLNKLINDRSRNVRRKVEEMLETK